jgi:hypothetical protein
MRRPTSRRAGSLYTEQRPHVMHELCGLKTPEVNHADDEDQSDDVDLPEHTVGVDLGDRKSAICRLDTAGDVVDRRTISTTRLTFEAYCRALPPSPVVLEVGTHSPWISRLLEELGHEVIVADPSKIRGNKGRRKSDKIDAEFLRRFLQHVLPAGFQKVRHFGYLSSQSRTRLETVRWLATLHGGERFVLRALSSPAPVQSPIRPHCADCGGDLHVVAVLRRRGRALFDTR